MNLKFLKICIKKKMPFGAQWESFTIKTPFTFQKSDWKQMVKCAANKRQSHSVDSGSRTKCELQTHCPNSDRSRRGTKGAHEQDTQAQARSPPTVHFWSVWQVTLIQYDYPEQKKGVSSWCVCFLKTQTTASFYSTKLKAKKLWPLSSKELMIN